MDGNGFGRKKIRQKEVAKTVRSGKYAEVGVNANRGVICGKMGVPIENFWSMHIRHCRLLRNIKKRVLPVFYIFSSKAPSAIALIEEAYSEGVISVIFLNCLEK